jgi:hypothetical protein
LLTAGARPALKIVLAVGLLLVLGANLPGHMSYDSVAQLYEGHFHVRETWGPAIYAWMLGVFDAIIPGPSLMVAALALLFFASLWALAAANGRITWLAVVFAGLMALTPQVLIYQGVVWKDVAFADAAIGGAACLAQALTHWDRVRLRWIWLAGALLLFAATGLVRQNGVLAPAAASLALGWVAARGSWRRGFAWGGGGLLAVAIAMQALTVFAVPAPETKLGAMRQGLLIVQNYDLIGAMARDPTYRLTEIEKVRPAEAAVMRAQGIKNWSPDRVDWLDRIDALHHALVRIPPKVTQRQWEDLILRHTGVYLAMRLDDFRWLLLTPVKDRCLPIYTGVDAPDKKMAPLRMPHRYSPADRKLANYDSFWEDTPAQSHWPYAIVAVAAGLLLLWRGRPADYAVAGLLAGVLAVTASFFVITIACDYRYLLILDLSAMVAVFYLLADPTGFRRTRAAGAG